MAILATAQFRIRPSGNDVNGGAYDPSISGALNTTLNGSITSGATTITVASATGWPGSGNYYARIGSLVETLAGGNGTAGFSEVVLVTGGQGTTTWTVTRAQLGTSALAQATAQIVDNDISRCDTALYSGTLGTSTASTTFTDAGASFNIAMVGMAIFLASGTGTTPGTYFITAVASGISLTLDRASGTYTAGVYKIGGAWANVQTFANPVISGNTCYVRGIGNASGTPGTPDYTHATANIGAGAPNSGYARVIGENGMPGLKGSSNTVATFSPGMEISNLYFIGAATGSTSVVIGSGTSGDVYIGCKFDQNGFDQTLFSGSSSASRFINCEFLNSGSAPAAANAAVTITSGSIGFYNCNAHDLTSTFLGATGDAACSGVEILNSIIASCGADSISIASPGASSNSFVTISGNTIDGGTGNGIVFSRFNSLAGAIVTNNIFSNITGAGKFAIDNTGNTQVDADKLKLLIDYNAFYNNTANYNAITAGTHDTALVTSPYVAQSTENYTLTAAAAAILLGAGYLGAAYPQSISGKTATVRSYVTPGAIQPNTQPGGLLVNPGMSGGVRG